jgi:uncharacterized RDD family membrane protein YckC
MPARRYDTFRPRLFAGIVDALIFLPLLYLDSKIYELFSARAVIVPWFVCLSFAYVAYSIYLHGRYGMTLGKRLFQIAVVDLSERPLSMRQAVRRDSVPLVLTALGVVLELPHLLGWWSEAPGYLKYSYFLLDYAGWAWFVAELISMFLNDKRRALHDFIAGSVVVRTRKGVSLH